MFHSSTVDPCRTWHGMIAWTASPYFSLIPSRGLFDSVLCSACTSLRLGTRLSDPILDVWSPVVSLLSGPWQAPRPRSSIAEYGLVHVRAAPNDVPPIAVPTKSSTHGCQVKQPSCRCLSLDSAAVHKSIPQVGTRGPTSLLTETPPLLAPNVSDCAEVLSQPSFTVHGAVGFNDSSFPNVMKCVVETRKRQGRVLKWRQVPLVKETYDSAVLLRARKCPQGTYSA